MNLDFDRGAPWSLALQTFMDDCRSPPTEAQLAATAQAEVLAVAQAAQAAAEASQVTRTGRVRRKIMARGSIGDAHYRAFGGESEFFAANRAIKRTYGRNHFLLASPSADGEPKEIVMYSYVGGFASVAEPDLRCFRQAEFFAVL